MFDGTKFRGAFLFFYAAIFLTGFSEIKNVFNPPLHRPPL